MATFNSASYLALELGGQLADPRDEGGKEYLLPFQHTVGVEASGDVVNLRRLPKGCQVIGLDVSNDALGASTTMSLGDTQSATRYLAATAVTTAGKNSGLLSAGQNFRPAVDTIFTLTWGGATPTAAAVVKGVLRIMRSA
jgi:hypothetical protein